VGSKLVPIGSNGTFQRCFNRCENGESEKGFVCRQQRRLLRAIAKTEVVTNELPWKASPAYALFKRRKFENVAHVKHLSTASARKIEEHSPPSKFMSHLYLMNISMTH
jgi:hypothetical protein